MDSVRLSQVRRLLIMTPCITGLILAVDKLLISPIGLLLLEFMVRVHVIGRSR